MSKLHGNRAYIEPDLNPAANGLAPINLSSDHSITHSIRIEVYREGEYLGKKIFSQNRIIIGKSLEADLVLSDDAIADRHACITFIDDQPVILDQTQKSGLLIRGNQFGISIIDSSEQVGLGPFILKIRHHKTSDDQIHSDNITYADNSDEDIRAASGIDLSGVSEDARADSPEQNEKAVEHEDNNEKPEVDLFGMFEGGSDEDHDLYDLIFEGDVKTGQDIGNVKINLSRIFKSDESRIEHFFSRKMVVLKSALKIDIAKKYKKVFEKSGAVCRLTAHKGTEEHDVPVQDDVSPEIESQTHEQDAIREETNVSSPEEPENKTEQSESSPVKEKNLWKFYGFETDDEEDEDEEDLPADFSLKDRINELNKSGLHLNSSNKKYLEVIKLCGREVIDIQHLEEKERFYISDDNNKRFCLAEFKKANEALFSFNKNLEGNLEIDGEQSVATQVLMKDKNCISKRKGIYRIPLPGNGKAVLSDGYFDYQMRMVGGSLVPEIPEIKESNKKSYRHFGVSFAFHIVFLTFLGLFPSFDSGKKIEDEARFVQLDTNQLAELEKVMKPQPKPKPPEPAPVVEPQLKKEPKPAVLKKEPVRVASNKKPSKSKTVSRPSRHPDAGGGFGEGNVSTRNINETGILGMISDSVGIQPRNALAAVTNLDAVSSPNVTAGNLKVGGVVGHIGTGEIAVPKGSIISTKGSSQVLRSYGRKGEGTVAALEKGKTGEQEVMGMVTATLDKSVRIRGGLSMEAVKRVIDEHLDDITYCYETELIANPSIVGKVMFEWKILMTGEVGEVRIKSSSINSHEIHACIKEAIRTWRFPKPSGSEVLVSYPFVFDIVGF